MGKRISSKRKYDKCVGELINNLKIIDCVYKNERARYTVECFCGNIFETDASKIHNKHTKSCGCLRNNNKYEEYIGKKIGYLTILSVIRGSKNGMKPRFVCKCDCGNSIERACRPLVLDNSIYSSCGCVSFQKIKFEKETIPKYLGKKFNRFIVLDVYMANRKAMATCKCDCGEVREVYISNLDRNRHNSCGCEKAELSSIRGSESNPCKSFSKYSWFFYDMNNEKVRVRSSYEVILANYFLDNSIPFYYEPETFILKNNMRYTPDFYLPNASIYIEVKGLAFGDHYNKQLIKYKLFRKEHRLDLYFWEDIKTLADVKKYPQYYIERSKKIKENIGISIEEFFANRYYLN